DAGEEDFAAEVPLCSIRTREEPGNFGPLSRVTQAGHALAAELDDWEDDRRTGRAHRLEGRVDALDLQLKDDGRAAERRRCVGTPGAGLLGHGEDRLADHQIGMRDHATPVVQVTDLLAGSERSHVEVDRARGISDDEQGDERKGAADRHGRTLGQGPRSRKLPTGDMEAEAREPGWRGNSSRGRWVARSAQILAQSDIDVLPRLRYRAHFLCPISR